MTHFRTVMTMLAVSLILSCWTSVATAEWRGLMVAPESRCAPYDRKDYHHPQSVEARIIAAMDGLIYGPYTGRIFASKGETDIEHIVAVSEAHDSGLCAADEVTRRAFARDLLNLTLAAPQINRCSRDGKCAKDAAEWLPMRNRCWFADRVVQVRRKYSLTVDQREVSALEAILSGCTSTDIIFHTGSDTPPKTDQRKAQKTSPSSNVDALALWDDNGNGRITCKEARRHGIAPVPRSHPAYPYMRDADDDGVVCE